MARRDGDLESKGSFTWNLDRAMDVLSQYQLADKSGYLLRVKASLVQPGCHFGQAAGGYQQAQAGQWHDSGHDSPAGLRGGA